VQYKTSVTTWLTVTIISQHRNFTVGCIFVEIL